MANYKNLIEALTIFQKYAVYQEVAAEHDEIFAGPYPAIVSADDLARLEELYWHPCEFDCFRSFV